MPAWETCDRYGLVDGWLPEWTRMRSLPQHNPVHRFTLDRHLVQTAHEASRHAREVDRPDLLLLGALLHDIGKGLPGDHSTVGAPIAAGGGRPDRAARRPRSTLIGKLVRLHLLLPDVATRRDLADPVTIAAVAEAVGDAAHPRPAARAGPRRRRGDRPGRLVGLEGPAGRRAGRPGAHRAGHRRAARRRPPRTRRCWPGRCRPST